ncbi:MAG: DUF2214 family protein [Pseudomonadales bacterium]|nr:DUF2214 family protein [Pseudomonadales bacterium]
MIYVLLRYIHLIAVLVLVGGVLIENAATKKVINQEDARNLARVDAACGMSVVVILAAGLVLWFAVGKPPEFYTPNPVFQAKLALFIALLGFAIKPALFFMQHKNTEKEEISVPNAVRLCLRAEIAIVVIMPVLAWLMARGVGLPA